MDMGELGLKKVSSLSSKNIRAMFKRDKRKLVLVNKVVHVIPLAFYESHLAQF